MFDSFLDFIVVLLPTVLSIVGVIVSFKVPQSQRHRVWIIGLFVFGITVSGLTFWQQSRTKEAQKIKDEQISIQQKDLQKKLDTTLTTLTQSQLAQEYMKGQLSSISVMAGKISNAISQPELKQATRTMQEIAQPPVKPKPISDKQLCSNTFSLANTMRKFETDKGSERFTIANQFTRERNRAESGRETFEILKRESDAISQHDAVVNYQYKTAFLPEAIYLRGELLRRVAPQKQPDHADSAAFGDLSTGWRPINTLANYLEELAKRFCPIG